MIFGEGPIIKNIAGDLNKLFLQGTRAGQPINNVEGDAAADQATIELLASTDPVIREVSVGMVGNDIRDAVIVDSSIGSNIIILRDVVDPGIIKYNIKHSTRIVGSGIPDIDNKYSFIRPRTLRIHWSKDNLLPMLDNNIVIGKYISNSGGITDNVNNWYYSEYLPVKGNSAYTFSASRSLYYASIMEYDKDYNFIKRSGVSNADHITITTNSNTAYVLVGSNIDNATVTQAKIAAVNWQFEFGDHATSYSPVTTLSINIAGGSISPTYGGELIFERKIGASGSYYATASRILTHSGKTLIGSSSEYYYSGGNNSFRFSGWQYNWSDSNNPDPELHGTYTQTVSYNDRGTLYSISGSGSSLYLNVGQTTMANMRTFLASNNYEYFYKLKQQQVISMSGIAADVNVGTDTNIIWVDGDGCNIDEFGVTYLRRK